MVTLQRPTFSKRSLFFEIFAALLATRTILRFRTILYIKFDHIRQQTNLILADPPNIVLAFELQYDRLLWRCGCRSWRFTTFLKLLVSILCRSGKFSERCLKCGSTAIGREQWIYFSYRNYYIPGMDIGKIIGVAKFLCWCGEKG